MKTSIEKLLALLVCIFLSAWSNAQKKTDHKPNVIIIYTDDQGTIDINSFGANDLYTPHMDKLAETGVKFIQFYAAAPICSPSRAALLTGRTPLDVGLPKNAGKEGLAGDQLTLSEKLKEHGYATGLVGKWHLGMTKTTVPNAQGFDYSFGHLGGCIDNYSHFFYWHGPNRHDLWENGTEIWRDGAYFQDLMAQKTDLFLEEHQNRPFFLYYAINLPHYPLQGTDKWREHYKDLESPRNKYAAAVSTMDENIGKLLSKLDELNLRKNTLIILQSDHGHSMEERTFGGGGDSGPYRGAKFSLFEGGIRVPAIISWPDQIPRSESRNQMAVNVDWFPTILDFCDIAFDKGMFEGESLKDVIMKNTPSPHEAFWWYSEEDRWAVRKGDWKLLKNPIDPSKKTVLTEKDSLYLVNIKTDPGELVNMIQEHPDKVIELQKTYDAWRKGKQ